MADAEHVTHQQIELNRLRVLLVEDSPDDAELIEFELTNAGYQVSALRVDSEPEMRQALATGEWDIILADHSIPGFGSVQALNLLKQAGEDIPFIIVSGSISENTAIAAMRAGARDYILKDNLTRLLPAVQRELQEAVTRRQKRQAEAALRESEQRLRAALETSEKTLAQLRAILDSMTEGLYIVDRDGHPVMINRVLQDALGVDPQSILEEERAQFDIFDLNGAVLPREQWPTTRVLKGETIKHCELRVRRRTPGNEWILRYNGAPVRDKDGTVMMAVLTIEDITAAKHAEQVLIRNEKLAATGRLAATIAHEINNPLQGIMSLVYLLRTSVEDPNLQEKSRQYVEMIDAQLQAVARIASQTLKLNRDKGSPQTFLLSELLSELLDFYQANARKQGVRLEKRLETGGRIVGFAGEIRQVMSNLVLNATEATPKGGNIIVHLYEGVDWRDTARRGYRVTILDSGTGISPQHRSRIFEPFFTTKEETGTGLGLWVSLGIIVRAGGSMRVWSTQKTGRSGTCFSIFLPAEVPVTERHRRRRYEGGTRDDETAA